MEKYIDMLAQIALFDDISPSDISKILKCLQAHKEKYKKESLIRSEGDPADFIGIVLEGKIQILQYNFDGNRNITASFSEGDIFAESISCAGIPALPCSIQAVTNCEILFLNEKQILHQCDERCSFHSQMIQNLLKMVARKNVLLNRKLRYITQKTTAEKIMSFLLDQSKIHGSKEFFIPFNRQDLADYLGVERSAMSTEINKLQKQGILETKRNYFKLK